MTKARESPSPGLTLALSSKWRGDSVEGEEIATGFALAMTRGSRGKRNMMSF